MEKDISLFCLKYAESVLPESMVFRGGNPKKQIPITFAIYLIHSGPKNILVDAGCDTMPGFHMKNFVSPLCVLEQIGLIADDITDVVITHAHHDHIDLVRCFQNAVIHITKEEFSAGESYIPKNMAIHLIDREWDIAEHIKVLKIGGHSPGSAIVKIAQESITYVIAGDECYCSECIARKIPTGSSFQVAKSHAFITKYSDRTYSVLTMHDKNLKTEQII